MNSFLYLMLAIVLTFIKASLNVDEKTLIQREIREF